jgi:uncharacterized protein
MVAFIQFSANDIRLEGLEVDLELPEAWLAKVLADTDVRVQSAGRLVGRLSRSGNDIVVRGRLTADVELPCVRCLEPAKVAVRTELSLLLQPLARPEGTRGRGKKDKDEEYEFSAGEADLDVYDGETVVLDQFVREAILLEVPAFPLCDESCPGIAEGAVGEVESQGLDPRLAPLSAFRKNDGPATIEQLVAAAAERSATMGKKPILRANNRPGLTGRKKGKK